MTVEHGSGTGGKRQGMQDRRGLLSEQSIFASSIGMLETYLAGYPPYTARFKQVEHATLMLGAMGELARGLTKEQANEPRKTTATIESSIDTILLQTGQKRNRSGVAQLCASFETAALDLIPLSDDTATNTTAATRKIVAADAMQAALDQLAQSWETVPDVKIMPNCKVTRKEGGDFPEDHLFRAVGTHLQSEVAQTTESNAYPDKAITAVTVNNEEVSAYIEVTHAPVASSDSSQNTKEDLVMVTFLDKPNRRIGEITIHEDGSVATRSRSVYLVDTNRTFVAGETDAQRKAYEERIHEREWVEASKYWEETGGRIVLSGGREMDPEEIERIVRSLESARPDQEMTNRAVSTLN